MEAIEIFEVCPRDGLQPEPQFIETSKKIELVKQIADAGCKRIEITPFTHSERVPQMRDAKELFLEIPKKWCGI
jgi:hydroxymethylglutaryl-CoA lyase